MLKYFKRINLNGDNIGSIYIFKISIKTLNKNRLLAKFFLLAHVK